MCAMVKAYSYGLGGYKLQSFYNTIIIWLSGVAYADEGE